MYMDDDVEDIVGDVRYTDSQKSITTSNMYSLDYTDTSDHHDSTGKDTYVLECDSEDSDETYHQPRGSGSIVNITEIYKPPRNVSVKVQYEISKMSQAQCTSLPGCSLIAHESFTQTSKTIIELAETDAAAKRTTQNRTLDTQTSFLSISENKSVEYRIEVSSAHSTFTKNDIVSNFKNGIQKKPTFFNITCNKILSESLEDGSSKFPATETENDITEDNDSVSSSSNEIIKIIDDTSKENMLTEDEPIERQFDNTSDFNDSEPDSDIEEDSLMENVLRKSARTDVRNLHGIISERREMPMLEKFDEPDLRRFGTLTPLTEESVAKKESIVDITPKMNNVVDKAEKSKKDEVLFTSKAGMKVKMLKDYEIKNNSFRLPPILNQSCPNSPQLNNLFNKSNNLNKAGTLQYLYEGQKERKTLLDRWEIGTKDLAAGESPNINGRNVSPRRQFLPPIHNEALNNVNSRPNGRNTSSDIPQDAISIKGKIKELKTNAKHARSWTQPRKLESRSASPTSLSSPEEMRLYSVAERGCEPLCAELLRRLRGPNWFDVIETLEEMPGLMEKFWGVIAEQRIADLIRQVNALIESPRTQVARSACHTVAAILKNTNYTKKPDFYEAVTVLLIKTGSYSRPVRRAANVALDDIVCGVDLSQAVTALCIHGAGHKNALVRCAAARLLIVCCALAGGGRELLRSRPPTAAAARKYALRSLAALLGDKNADTRKYAERLYSMLRPLSSFEAYYLTDVEVDLACKQMKKYDQLLLCGPANEAR